MSKQMTSIRLMMENLSRLPLVHVRLYDTLEEMRETAEKISHSQNPDDHIALGFTQIQNGEPNIRLSTQALSIQVICHETAHAALYLRQCDECTKQLPADENQDIKWHEETYCHIYDQLLTEILDWIITGQPTNNLSLYTTQEGDK